MTDVSHTVRLATPVDIDTYGEYRIPDTPGPLVRFTDRIGPSGDLAAEAGRYHVYGGWFCPWSHRVAIARALAGLTEVVSMSFVDGARDGRGWAFRERYGPDPVNGFALLREAYEATRAGFDGHVSVPALWDRVTGRLVSNDCVGIGLDFATRFEGLAAPVVRAYPEPLRDRIDELDRWLGPAVNSGAGRAAEPGPAREALLAAFAELDDRLAGSRFLLGDEPTEADVRLWVTLVRYDVGVNAGRTVNPGLHVYPRLWSYARDLYRIPAFRDTTDFAAFARPGARLPDWDAPVDR